LKEATVHRWQRIALVGVSDLAEIATICALETGIKIVAVVDPQCALKKFVGVPVLASLDKVGDQVDCVVITDLKAAQETAKVAVERFGASRVLIPNLLGVRINDDRGVNR
jgi:predicted CoA-binding protein